MLTVEEIFYKLEKEIPIKSHKGGGNNEKMELWYMINEDEVKYVLDDFKIETVNNLINKINNDIKEKYEN